eukprot:scaffold28649_cov111-Isochrysis_galbana.AAC.3
MCASHQPTSSAATIRAGAGALAGDIVVYHLEAVLFKDVSGERPRVHLAEREPHRVEGAIVERRAHSLGRGRPFAHQLLHLGAV